MSSATRFIPPAISLRNTVWLALALALVAAPHAERLPVWLSVLAAAACAWRLYLARMRLTLPARWLSTRPDQRGLTHATAQIHHDAACIESLTLARRNCILVLR